MKFDFFFIHSFIVWFSLYRIFIHSIIFFCWFQKYKPPRIATIFVCHLTIEWFFFHLLNVPILLIDWSVFFCHFRIFSNNNGNELVIVDDNDDDLNGYHFHPIFFSHSTFSSWDSNWSSLSSSLRWVFFSSLFLEKKINYNNHWYSDDLNHFRVNHSLK